MPPFKKLQKQHRRGFKRPKIQIPCVHKLKCEKVYKEEEGGFTNKQLLDRMNSSLNAWAGEKAKFLINTIVCTIL